MEITRRDAIVGAAAAALTPLANASEARSESLPHRPHNIQEFNPDYYVQENDYRTEVKRINRAIWCMHRAAGFALHNFDRCERGIRDVCSRLVLLSPPRIVRYNDIRMKNESADLNVSGTNHREAFLDEFRRRRERMLLEGFDEETCAKVPVNIGTPGFLQKLNGWTFVKSNAQRQARSEAARAWDAILVTLRSSADGFDVLDIKEWWREDQ